MKKYYKLLTFLLIFLCLSISGAPAKEAKKGDYDKYPKVQALATCYFAHRWSDQGAYQKVSRNGKRLGNFVALNFLPAGSVIMIPELFKTSRLTVADTMGGSGIACYRGKNYWKIDILRNKNEWIKDIDRPLDVYIVKINKNGMMRKESVRRNYQTLLSNLKLPDKSN